MKIAVMVIHIFVSIGLIITVLLHSGKGGGLAGAFGGGTDSTFSGSSMMEKNLDKITIVFAVVFLVTSLILVILFK